MTSRKDLSVSDRIAALQRGSSPQPQGDRHASPPGTTPSLPLSHSLKDKIAHFDALGTAPKPVGSFGLGAPPAPAEHRAVNRELYGNRIPSVNHKTGRSVSSGKELSQFASASTSSLDAHDRTDSRASSHASEGNNDATSPTGSAQGPPSAVGHSSAGVPEIRRTDSMTEHWVDDQHSKPAISLDLSSATAAVALAPPSPIPDSEDATFPSGPTTPLTSTLIRHLGTSSHVPSRLGNETPVSMMVETGSLVDGEQPNLVPEEDNVPVPSSPVVTGMQALGLSDVPHAEGETTPTREAELGALKTPDVPSDVSVASVAGSLAPPTISGPGDEGPNTPLARSVEVEEPVTVVSLADNSTESGLNLSTGEQAPAAPQGSELTASNVRQLNAEESGLAPSVRPSGPSSVVVEAGSVARSLQPSPAPHQAGAQTPEPVSALTPKQSLSELPTLGHGSVPLSAASLRLLNLEGGMKGGRRDGAETPMSVQVETGSVDGRPRDLEGVDAPIATPAPASPAASYFEESKADVVMQPEQPRTDESETTKDTTSHANVANSEPDNRSTEQGPPVPAKDIPKIVTNASGSVPIIVDSASPTEMQTPTNKKFPTGVPFPVGSPTTPLARVPNLHKSRSRPDFSTASTSSAPDSAPPAVPQTLAAPNSGLQRRATTGSKAPQRRRVSRIPQMQLLPSGQWGVVDDDSEEEDTGGWAKVVVSRSRLS